MILFINGPFGVGKTTTARLLVEGLPDAVLYDPEIVGAFVCSLTEDFEQVEDFQDHRLWETMVVEAARALREGYGGPLVIPMTVWRPGRFWRLTEGLRDVDPDLRLFWLAAPEETVRGRIFSRPDAEGNHEWCLKHLATCTEALRDPLFGVEVGTDDLTPHEVADEILKAARPTVVE